MPQPKNKPLVSIIIPTLNEAENIASLLESLKYSEAETIISDGGSSDTTLEICSRYPVRLVKSSRGRGIQLNTGAAHAQGEILLFLHADSHIDEQVLNDIRKTVAGGRLWGCCTMRFNETALIFKIVAWFSNLRSRIFSSCCGDQAVFCQHEFFRKSGGFQNTVFLEDLEFSHRLRRQQKGKVISGQVITSTRRFRTAGIWRTIARNQVAKLAYAAGVSPGRLWQWYQSG